MNILCVGDIVGRPGREAVQKLLPALREEYALDCVIINAENSAGGFGITVKVAEELFSLGCDVITLGDHVWDKQDIYAYLDEQKKIIRPANFPEGAPGRGFTIVTTSKGHKVAVVNLLGRTFMRYSVDCPFKTLKAIIKDVHKETSIIVVDMHAEATSEKVALGRFVDGDVSVVFGTHTHVQTADEKILPKQTAYITDLGMTGPYDSVIGQNKNAIIERFLTSMPVKFEVAKDDVWLHGIVVNVDERTGKANSITRVQKSTKK